MSVIPTFPTRYVCSGAHDGVLWCLRGVVHAIVSTYPQELHNIKVLYHLAKFGDDGAGGSKE